jgi:hypothetical protein
MTRRVPGGIHWRPVQAVAEVGVAWFVENRALRKTQVE